VHLPTPRRAVTLALDLSVLVLPHGGQHTSRRNAWAGMVSDATRTRQRTEAELALAQAAQRAPRSVAL